MIRRRVPAGALGLALWVGLVACSGGTAGTAGTATPIVASPLTGRVVAIDAAGLTKVRGFTLRMDAGAEIPFVIGVLENGVEFPPGHLAEHMGTASAIRVFFRDENGERVVYRIEDAEQ